MRKILLSLFVWMALSASMQVTASPVGAGKAKQVAYNFLKANGIADKELVDITATTGYREFYIFTAVDGRGFVLVSADDCVIPILGWSATNAFVTEGMPENLRRWLDSYEEDIHLCRSSQHQNGIVSIPANSTAQQQWQHLMSGSMPTNPFNTEVLPLINTAWAQMPYYNDLCPFDSIDNSRTVTGCVATATGQLMRYWSHPDTGYGSHTYTHSTYGTLSANFNTAYNWTAMPTQLTGSSTTAEIEAVATLMQNIGVAVEMNYGTTTAGGSGASTLNNGLLTQPSTENALRYYFKYKSSLHGIKKSDTPDSVWCALLRNELDNGRPIIYDGFDSTGGHSFLCDGYNSSGLFHFNWGWNGYSNGYFAIGSLNPSSVTSPHSFNSRNIAIIGIEPNNNFGGNTTVTVLSNNGSYGSVSGSGTYSGTGSTAVNITATAAVGKRFAGWNDGYMYNPRSFYANGGNYTFTANFEPLTGDTLGYCSETQIARVGSGTGTCYWGIRLPASVLTAGHNLTTALLYVVEPGNYTLNVYTGTSSPTTLMHTQTFTVTSGQEGGWMSVPLTTPVAVTGNLSLWITFSSSGTTRPVALTYYCGNNHSRLWGRSFTPSTSWNYSYMVRGVFAAPPVYEDTVSFCGDDTVTRYTGASGDITWGIRLPPAMHSHRKYLTDVMLYVPSAGTYNLHVYQGDSTSEATQLSWLSTTYNAASSAQWQLIHLPFPVTLNDSLPLWIVFQNNTTAYPATVTNFSGDTNGSLITRDGGTTWKSIYTASHGSLNGSWMIKAILSNLLVTPYDLSGPVSVGVDIPATYTVSCTYPATFNWTATGASLDTNAGTTVTALWDSVGSYTVVLEAECAGVQLFDTLYIDVHQCGVTAFPYTMGFEVADDLSCWRILDRDNDGHTWAYTADDTTLAHSGTRAFTSTSHGGASSTHPTDNWVVTPRMQLDSDYYYRLTWHDRAADATHLSGHYTVYIIPSPLTLHNPPFEIQGMSLFQTTPGTTHYTQRILDLSSYAGQDIHIAYRLHNTPNGHGIIIDDITLTQTSPNYYTLTVLAADTAMGYTSGGGSYADGTEAILAAVAREGYSFQRWSDNSTAPVRPVTVTANRSYTALFTPHTAHDTIILHDTLAADTLFLYDTAYITDTLYDTTFVFDTLFIRDTTFLTDTLTFFDTTIVERLIHDTVWITQPRHQLTVISAQPAQGIAVGSGRYSDSTVVEIAAIPVSGNRFTQWSDGSSDNPRHILVTGDLSLTASFEADNIAITDVENDGITITTNGHDINVQGAYGEQIRIFDAIGRQLTTCRSTAATHTFRMPAAGVYLVQTGNRPAHRIVIID